VDIKELLNKIDKTKDIIEKIRPLTEKEIEGLFAYYRVGLTYTSNALEGNTLTLNETKILLEDGITVGGKPLKYIYEAVGHSDAYDFMVRCATDKNYVIKEDDILYLHYLFYNKIAPENAGVYKKQQNYITGSNHIPASIEDVPVLMKDFVKQLNEKWNSEHPVILSAFAHKGLVDIHPFIDGNGRTSRLLMNYILAYHKKPLAIVFKEDRLAYINALEESRKLETTEPFKMFMYEQQAKYLQQEIDKIEKQDKIFIPKLNT